MLNKQIRARAYQRQSASGLNQNNGAASRKCHYESESDIEPTPSSSLDATPKSSTEETDDHGYIPKPDCTGSIRERFQVYRPSQDSLPNSSDSETSNSTLQQMKHAHKLPENKQRHSNTLWQQSPRYRLRKGQHTEKSQSKNRLPNTGKASSRRAQSRPIDMRRLRERLEQYSHNNFTMEEEHSIRLDGKEQPMTFRKVEEKIEELKAQIEAHNTPIYKQISELTEAKMKFEKTYFPIAEPGSNECNSQSHSGTMQHVQGETERADAHFRWKMRAKIMGVSNLINELAKGMIPTIESNMKPARMTEKLKDVLTNYPYGERVMKILLDDYLEPIMEDVVKDIIWGKNGVVRTVKENSGFLFVSTAIESLLPKQEGASRLETCLKRIGALVAVPIAFVCDAINETTKRNATHKSLKSIVKKQLEWLDKTIISLRNEVVGVFAEKVHDKSWRYQSEKRLSSADLDQQAEEDKGIAEIVKTEIKKALKQNWTDAKEWTANAADKLWDNLKKTTAEQRDDIIRFTVGTYESTKKAVTQGLTYSNLIPSTFN